MYERAFVLSRVFFFALGDSDVARCDEILLDVDSDTAVLSFES